VRHISNSSLEGGFEPKARLRVFVQTPLPDFVGTPLKRRILLIILNKEFGLIGKLITIPEFLYLYK
ncbi:MAG: hypothetical protein J0M18_10650, partial [Ignavibacteria bacterium]|nr:hypothetical protein [Ignavibacteria bacterium]